MSLRILSILLFSIIVPKATFANEKIKVVTSHWPKYTNPDGTGLYFDILTEAFGKEGYTFKLVPWKRAQNEFSNGKYDLLLGETGDLKTCLYPLWPIDADFLSAFHLKSKVPALPKTQDLKNYKVIWVRGYDFNNFIPGLSAFAEVDDVQQGIKFIRGGRAEILIDYDQDMKDYIKLNKLDPLENLVTSTEISGGNLYICGNPKKDKTKLILNSFDKTMDRLLKSGQLEKLFKKYERMKNFKKISQSPPKIAP